MYRIEIVFRYRFYGFNLGFGTHIFIFLYIFIYIFFFRHPSFFQKPQIQSFFHYGCTKLAFSEDVKNIW